MMCASVGRLRQQNIVQVVVIGWKNILIQMLVTVSNAEKR